MASSTGWLSSEIVSVSVGRVASSSRDPLLAEMSIERHADPMQPERQVRHRQRRRPAAHPIDRHARAGRLGDDGEFAVLDRWDCGERRFDRNDRLRDGTVDRRFRDRWCGGCGRGRG